MLQPYCLSLFDALTSFSGVRAVGGQAWRRQDSAGKESAGIRLGRLQDSSGGESSETRWAAERFGHEPVQVKDFLASVY